MQQQIFSPRDSENNIQKPEKDRSLLKSRLQKFRTEDFSLRRKLQNQSCFGKLKVICKGIQQYIYVLLEDPNSSLIAYLLQFLLLTSILLSCAAIIVDSLMEDDDDPNYNQLSFYLEYYLFIFFGLEYILRLFSSTAFEQSLMKFILSPLNMIDLLAIMPFLFNLIFEGASLSGLRVIRIVRFMRIFRLFKLSRFMKDMLILVDTVKHSAKDIIILITLFLFLVLFFSIIMYYVEFDPDQIDDEQKIHSITEAIWWCIATMTTVGYGDKIPLSIQGKMIACIAAFFGITSISLPVAVMGMNLTQTLNEHEENIEIQKIKEQLIDETQYNVQKQQQLNIKELKFMERRLEQLLENNQKVMDFVELSQRLFDEVTQDLMSLYSALTEQLDLHIESKMKNLKARHRIMKMEKNLNQKKSIELSSIVQAFKEKQKMISQGSILVCEESQQDLQSIASRQSNQYTIRKSKQLKSKNSRGSFMCILNQNNNNPFKTQSDYNEVVEQHQNSIIYAQVSSRNSALNQDVFNIGGNAEFKFNLEDSSGNIDEEDDQDYKDLSSKMQRFQIEKQYQKLKFMNFYDQQFLETKDHLSQGYYFSDLKYMQETNQFIQEYDDNQQYFVYILDDYYFATKGEFLFKVAYANNPCNSFEFINGLQWNQINGYGIDKYIRLKLKTPTFLFLECQENNKLNKLFDQIYTILWIDSSIDKLQATKLIYNSIHYHQLSNNISPKQISDLYFSLLKSIKLLKETNFNFKKKVVNMKTDFIIFQLYEYQHFPGVKRNCNICKVCKKHKSKFYCQGCYLLSNRRWSLCLDDCFLRFHIDPLKYGKNRKKICIK